MVFVGCVDYVQGMFVAFGVASGVCTQALGGTLLTDAERL